MRSRLIHRQRREGFFFIASVAGPMADVIGFAMRSEALSFPDAVRAPSPRGRLADPRLFARGAANGQEAPGDAGLRMETAAAWYEQQLKAPAGRRGPGIPEAAAASAMPPSPGSAWAMPRTVERRLRDALAKAGVPWNWHIEAGLIARPMTAISSTACAAGSSSPRPIGAGRVIALGGPFSHRSDSRWPRACPGP